MPYKYVSSVGGLPDTEPKEPKITKTKEIEKPKPQTEDEYQEQYNNEQSKAFFEEDDDIIEVNFE